MTAAKSTRLVAEAERQIAAGEVSEALDSLKTAAGMLPWGWPSSSDAAEIGALSSRIRKLADAIPRDYPSCAPQVQVIKDTLATREGRSIGDEPSSYRVAEVLATAALIMGGLSVVAGIVVGIAASKYTSYDGSTHHRGGVVFLGIVSGLFAAALWLVIAIGLDLLVDIGRTVRSSSSKS